MHIDTTFMHNEKKCQCWGEYLRTNGFDVNVNTTIVFKTDVYRHGWINRGTNKIKKFSSILTIPYNLTYNHVPLPHYYSILARHTRLSFSDFTRKNDSLCVIQTGSYLHRVRLLVVSRDRGLAPQYMPITRRAPLLPGPHYNVPPYGAKQSSP
jgi:hypothetical protein